MGSAGYFSRALVIAYGASEKKSGRYTLVMLPAAVIWLSLISIISASDLRWFTAPPVVTAYFSNTLYPFALDCN